MAAAVAACLGAACPDGGAPAEEADGDAAGGPVCPWDDAVDWQSAVPLALDEAVEGWLCPVDDVDWYAFETGPADHLLTVRLAMDGELSPVQPSYAVWARGAGEGPGKVVAAPPPELIGLPLDVVHCVAPGAHWIAVKDDQDDAQDLRRSYRLSVSSAPDPDPGEPNDDAAGARPLASGQVETGAIACRGDRDWFRVEGPDGSLLRVRLDVGVAGFQPAVGVLDDEGRTVAREENLAAALKETAVDRLVVVPGAGTYFVVVEDDDGLDADPGAPWTLVVDVVADADPNEPNFHPDLATPLAAGPVACGPGWSPWVEASGTVAAPGDVDWYVLPVTGCGRGVVEAELRFPGDGLGNAAQWALQKEVQASLSLVRADALSPCTDDPACQALQRPCEDGWDCAGFSNTCRPDGLCAGASVCLPEGACGALVVERHHVATAIPSPITGPPDHVARLSAPLASPSALWLRAGDFQGNGGAPDVPYALRVRVRRDTDDHEPSNLYAPVLLQSSPTGVQQGKAVDVPVLPCVKGTLPGDPPPQCCDETTWIEGAVSYENDVDWYRYDHPCPGEDCMLRVHYRVDAGPVDTLFAVYRGGSLWYDALAPVEELRDQPAREGTFGGLDPGDACFYAYQGHGGDPFRYFLAVRDLAVEPDWDPEQGYAFCIEKVAEACLSPCTLYEDGCGQ